MQNTFDNATTDLRAARNELSTLLNEMTAVYKRAILEDAIKRIERTLETLSKQAAIHFVHDDECAKWEVMATGVETTQEAVQAFTAVALAVQALEPQLLKHTKVTEDFNIIPAVRR